MSYQHAPDGRGAAPATDMLVASAPIPFVCEGICANKHAVAHFRAATDMNVTVRIPDGLAERLAAEGGGLERRVLESLAVTEYQAGRLTRPELRRLLGFSTRYQLDG